MLGIFNPIWLSRSSMSLCNSLAYGLLFVFASVVAEAQDAQGRPPFKSWLGPQTNKTARFPSVVGQVIDVARHDKLPRYDLSLKIIKGTGLRMPASKNAIVTFDGTEFQQTKDFAGDKDARYVVAQMQLKKGQPGWRFYTLNVRITAGALKGAVVHLRDGKIQDSMTDPCIAVYRIPGDLKVDEGNVPFEVVALFAK